MNLLEVKDLHVAIDGKEIIKGVSFIIKKGERVAIMGPNGSGKSSLSNALMGNPSYVVTSGQIIFEGRDITSMSVDERSRLGLFLSFQNPVEVPGLSLPQYLRMALNARKEMGSKVSVRDFLKLLKEKMTDLRIDESFVDRYLNEGFSGGEKKRCEILQMSILNPKLSILDEVDSGLDIDALKFVSEGINKITTDEESLIIITHYKRLLDNLNPNRIIVLKDGKIGLEGGVELIDHLEEKGYSFLEDQPNT